MRLTDKPGNPRAPCLRGRKAWPTRRTQHIYQAESASATGGRGFRDFLSDSCCGGGDTFVDWAAWSTILWMEPDGGAERHAMKNSFATEVQLLSDVAKAFAESLNLEETLMSILKSLDTHLRLQRGTITLLDPQTETINIKVAHGLSERSKSQGRYKVGEGITGRVVQTGEAIVVPDIARTRVFCTGPRPAIRPGQEDRVLLRADQAGGQDRRDAERRSADRPGGRLRCAAAAAPYHLHDGRPGDQAQQAGGVGAGDACGMRTSGCNAS